MTWFAVFSGAYVVYPWYRAVPPAGTTDLALYPRLLLLSNPHTSAWVSFNTSGAASLSMNPCALTSTAARRSAGSSNVVSNSTGARLRSAEHSGSTLLRGTTDTALVRRDAGMENAPNFMWRIGSSRWAKSHLPMGGLATPEEVAACALTLASDEHLFMTGAQMVIDGGKTAYAG